MFECIIGGLCCIGCVGCIGCCFCMKKNGKKSEKVLKRISEIYKSDPSGCRSLQAHFRNEDEASEDVLYLYKRLKKDAKFKNYCDEILIRITTANLQNLNY